MSPFKKLSVLKSLLLVICALSLIIPAAGFCASAKPKAKAKPAAKTAKAVKPKPAPKVEKVTAKAKAKTKAKTEAEEDTEVRDLRGALRLTIGQAALLAFEHNLGLMVERLAPDKQKTFEDEQLAVFDPVLGAKISASRETTPGSSGEEATTANTYLGEVSLSKYFPLGTFVDLSLSSTTSDASDDVRSSSSTLELAINQPLLRGYGSDVNLARLHQSRIATNISHYEFRAYGESLLAQVEQAYWNHALAVRQVEIVQQSVKLAAQQLKETGEMIRVGVMAESELPAAQAELAAQRQALINAKSDVQSTRLSLLRLLSPPGPDMFSRQLVLVHPPTLPELKLDQVSQHVARALAESPLIKQAELRIKDGDLELVRTRNGLLPKLDFFIRLGTTGYSDSFTWPVNSPVEDGYAAEAGLQMQYPLYNRAARAQHKYALLDREQSQKALDNLNQLVEYEMRQAFVELQRSYAQIEASSATRKLEEEKTRVVTESFRVGRSTNLAVAQAQRDLLESRIGEVSSVINYLKALVSFYRVEGTLLDRRGIVVSAR